MTTIRCPRCDGPLSLRAEGIQCGVGHSFTDDELDREMLAAIRRSLWIAVRSLDDEATRTGWLAQTRGGDGEATTVWQRHAEEARSAADQMRSLVRRWDEELPV